MFAIKNTYTGAYLSSGRDMATAANMVTFNTREAAEFAALELILKYPGTQGCWQVEAL